MASVPDDLSREIDGLFQLTLDEFTAARNALAKRAGPGGAAIKALEKPNAAAWAVNQLYWRRAPVFKALVTAAARLRAAHGRVLSGKGGDVHEAEAAHRVALKTAADEVRAILQESGETLSGATMSAVTETLQALPGGATPGRLTRPLKPMGLEALAGLVPGGFSSQLALAAAPGRAQSGDQPKTGKPAGQGSRESAEDARHAAARAKREAAARAKDIAAAVKDARAAQAVEREAASALTRARQALASAERERDRLQHQLQFAAKQIQDATDDLKRLEREAATAAAETTRIETRLAELRAEA